MPRHEVRQFRGLSRVADCGQRLFGDVLFDLRVAFKFFANRPHAGRQFVLGTRNFDQFVGHRFKEAVVLNKLCDPNAFLTLNEHLHSAIRQFQQLQHIRQNTRLVNVLCGWIILRRVNLARQQNLLVVLHHFFECPHRFLTPDEQRHDHVREHNDIAQRQDGIGGAEGFFHALVLFLAKRSGPAFRQPQSFPLEDTDGPKRPQFQASPFIPMCLLPRAGARASSVKYRPFALCRTHSSATNRGLFLISLPPNGIG